MATNAPERAFTLFPRGKVRDDIFLAVIRNGLRQLIDPETGALFTEERVRVATQAGSRPWITGEALDILGLAWQSRASFLADQIRFDHANTRMLREVWLPQWGMTPLVAVGGRGEATAQGNPGVGIIGSSTIPDPVAHTARDTAGIVYQVVETTVVPASGTLNVKFRAVSGGFETNLVDGTLLTWSFGPTGMTPQLVVDGDFEGGHPAETDADAIDRLGARIRYKPAAGNWSQFRSWARDASSSVEDAFVYCTALRAGSTVVCITQKRGKSLGPLARIPGLAALTDVTSYLVPPNSAVVPGRPHVVVVPPQSQPTDSVLLLSMRRASAGGWANAAPWPGKAPTGGAVAAVSLVTSQVDFRIHSDTPLPSGQTSLAFPLTPRIMRWEPTVSKFEELFVSAITALGGDLYRIQLSKAATLGTVAVGDYISPFTARNDTLQAAIEAYFDGLGPGEVVDLALDDRGDRAFRNPEPSREKASRAGQAIITQIGELLQSDVSAGDVFSMSDPTPALPSTPVAGPFLVTPRQVGVYDLT